MSIFIKETTNITKLKSLWTELYNNNSQLTTFDSYDFCKAINDDLIYRFMSNTQPRYFVIDVDGKKVIFPLAYNKFKQEYQFIHTCNGGEYCSPIFDSKLTENDLICATEYLVKSVAHPIIFADIANLPTEISWGGGKLSVYQTYSERLTQISNRDNVIINLADVENYENYYSSLSKNARQNLRTAYNRLNRDGKVIEFKFNRHLTNGQFNEIMELYVKRHEQRYGINTGSVKKWYLKHTNYSSKSLRKHINAAHAMLYVDGELAGFMSGYLKDKRWIIPRLSINSDYKFYSPGIILIDNVIKYMFENGLTILDLAKGDEPYKFQMGGECVKSYKFKM